MQSRTDRTRSTAESQRRVDGVSWRSAPWLAAVLYLAGAVAACGETLVEAEDLEPFAPLPVYRQWWVDLRRCAGFDGDFRDIRWYTGESVSLDGQDMFGFWAAPATIVLDRFYTTSAPVVKHEMLHHLTMGGMPHSHPAFLMCTSDSPTIATP